MSFHDELEAELQPFFESNLIFECAGPLKSGKEATVFLCRANPAHGASWLVAKIYRPFEHRTFRNDAAYQEGRWQRENRFRRAFRNKSRFGREVQAHAWIDHEWAMLRALHRAGVSVPRPRSRSGSAILMEYLGDDAAPAPALHTVDLNPEAARRTLSTLLAEVETMLTHNVVHGDLSAYNVLWWRDRPRIIDLPQAVDPRLNANARQLLARDVHNVCRACIRCGAEADPDAITEALWTRFQEGQL